jgi:hypothetical protein
LTTPRRCTVRSTQPSYVIDGGRPSSQALNPTPKDEGQLSVRHSPMSPAEAFEAHVAAGYQTAGTWGVTVSEVRVAGLRAVGRLKKTRMLPRRTHTSTSEGLAAGRSRALQSSSPTARRYAGAYTRRPQRTSLAEPASWRGVGVAFDLRIPLGLSQEILDLEHPP